jgi:hypothetical protein
MKNFSFESKQIRCRYFCIWRISGDGGVTDRGTYLFQADSLHLIKKLHEYCGDNCDDRQTYSVIYCSVPYSAFESLEDDITDAVFKIASLEEST